jgi:hypothetical protein
MHAFLKIPRRVDIPGPLESQSPLIPIVFVIPVFYTPQVVEAHCLYSTAIDLPLDRDEAVLYQSIPKVHQLSRSLRSSDSCSLTSKQLICVNSSIPRPSATHTRGLSSESGTVARSAPRTRTFAQIVRRSTPTTELTRSSCSRLLSISRRSGGFFSSSHYANRRRR